MKHTQFLINHEGNQHLALPVLHHCFIIRSGLRDAVHAFFGRKFKGNGVISGSIGSEFIDVGRRSHLEMKQMGLSLKILGDRLHCRSCLKK